MLQLFFVRHGETEWNVEKRLQGRLNSNLTENGIRDAELLGKRLATIDFEAVYSSPSNRTVETAKLIIDERTLPFKTDERLMEIDLGEWEGRTVDEIQQSEPELYHLYQDNPSQFKGTGETFADVKNRLEAVLAELVEAYPSGNLLIITHGVVIKVLQAIFKTRSLDLVWEPPYIEGTSLTIAKIEDGKRELLLEGDIAHKERKIV
ncbi:histidine phosphatase family protein [Robertmurraya yapensis]|uniref:Histidine phosphatase family protein n=2 Tax=Bacillaceae TaxID=186817 RepID=A0A431VZD0_9BACI|nr:histidine phosphatase family protein [Bacillus yapensis]RTR28476.1 histidine phosphatase family protein [Bacillus yapensis]TKS94537.1 histidine phosphatase family protein [Bacillus yapensis]